MTATRIAIEEKLSQLLGEYANDPYCREVLVFLRRHPYTRFSRLAIVHALNGHRLCVEQALTHLTDSGVIRRHLENNVPFYSLKEQV
ncbi:MAG: hypothetical protein OEW82_05450 [Dehalococcoidia bacterium]|nr:hypothetical protein [Dehalococcoidia bacterium]